MDLHWLKPLLGRPAPFTTVYLDASPSQLSAEAEAADRWKAVRRGLERDGAPAAVLDEIGERLALPDGRRTPHGRVLVADAYGVVVDRLLSAPPAQSEGLFGPAPALLQAIHAADETVDLLVVAVDRNGADLQRVQAGEHDARPTTEVVEGGHDEVHKTRGGGLDRRSQTRAEDSWQRNAEVVASALDRRVAEDPPDLLVLTGDVRAVALVREAVGQPVRDLLVEVPGGGRGEGVHEEAFHPKKVEAVDAFRARRRAATLARFNQALGQGSAAVTALDAVVEVLRRGQVAELVLGEGSAALSGRTLWVGSDPLQLATSAGDLAAMGVTSDARPMAADVALLRAALGQDAGVTFARDGEADVVEGVGALLRWADGSTPSGGLLSQSADTARLRTLV